ncbi:three-helix bundle dimerization domain-containing protein [Streptomyces phaeochromogenes]|uniref:three-helix bundle dimerization domain-containing protein n=1 Tax=Streptomyces phaeochromogenes TaxID=1923 RepID=UPI0033C57DBA
MDVKPAAARRERAAKRAVTEGIAATHLRRQFDGSFGEETAERFLTSNYDQFVGRRTIPKYLPLLAERFARQRLHALAKFEGHITDGKPAVLFLCVHNVGRSQMAMVPSSAAEGVEQEHEEPVLSRFVGPVPGLSDLAFDQFDAPGESGQTHDIEGLPAEGVVAPALVARPLLELLGVPLAQPGSPLSDPTPRPVVVHRPRCSHRPCPPLPAPPGCSAHSERLCADAPRGSAREPGANHGRGPSCEATADPGRPTRVPCERADSSCRSVEHVRTRIDGHDSPYATGVRVMASSYSE